MIFKALSLPFEALANPFKPSLRSGLNGMDLPGFKWQ